MRDIPFLLRLHALPPLTRFPRIHLKPYLPLEVRYLVRPSEEVFLYVSNSPDAKTRYEDLSLLMCEMSNALIPATGSRVLLGCIDN